MDRLIGTAALILLLLSGSAAAGEPHKESGDVQAVVQVLQAYEDAWSRHDARAIAAFYYEPAMRISPGGPIVRATRAMQEEFFARFLPNLVQQGYATSTWEHLEVRLLDANTAIGSGVVARRRGDGGLFQRQGVTYTLWRTETGWQIFLSATHPPGSALLFR